MTDDAAEAFEVLQRLSLRTKALVICSEYTRRQTEPAELRRVLRLLAPTVEERNRAIQAVEEELRAARYPVGEIVRLVSALTSEGAGGGAPPQDPNVVVTRKVRSPNLMPFEKFEFGPAEDKEGADGPVEAGAGESAPFSAKGLAHLAQRPEVTSGGPTVLVADDDGRARMMYRSKLEESGFAVVEAKDGIEAWSQIQGGGVHCAVMDMKMPGYHGLEILGRMVDANLILPVVVVSAFDQLANEFVVATYPKLRFLAKPAPPERVVEAVNSFLRPGKRVET